MSSELYSNGEIEVTFQEEMMQCPTCGGQHYCIITIMCSEEGFEGPIDLHGLGCIKFASIQKDRIDSLTVTYYNNPERDSITDRFIFRTTALRDSSYEIIMQNFDV